MGIDDSVQVKEGVTIPLAEIELKASRSSGPGGQHANVTDSRIEAVFDVEASTALDDTQKRRIVKRLGTRVTAVAQDSRSQARNRELALERLCERLKAALVVSRKRRPTKPSKAAKEKRLGAKHHKSRIKRLRHRPEVEKDD